MTTTAAVPGVAELLGDVTRAGELMRDATDVPAEVERAVDRVAEQLDGPGAGLLEDADPYLAQALLTATLSTEKALRLAGSARRREVRVGLERMRQALRDVADEAPARDTRAAPEVVRWLAETVTVPQPQLAALVGVSARTWQRWLSGQATPQGAEESRLRAVAQAAAHLRHSFTGPGVVRWFERRHPGLRDRPPAELLADPLELPRLVRLATASRAPVAS